MLCSLDYPSSGSIGCCRPAATDCPKARTIKVFLIQSNHKQPQSGEGHLLLQQQPFQSHQRWCFCRTNKPRGPQLHLAAARIRLPSHLSFQALPFFDKHAMPRSAGLHGPMLRDPFVSPPMQNDVLALFWQSSLPASG